MKRILLLGATGSIGLQTVDVIEQHPDQFCLVGIAAGHQADVMQKIIGSSAQSGGAEEAASSGVTAAEAAYEKSFGTASGTPNAAVLSTHEDTG